MDKGNPLMVKETGLSAFKRKPQPTEISPSSLLSTTIQRKRGKGETVALTLRLTRTQWERVHQLALSEGISLQQLCLHGLQKIFVEKGLPDLL